MREAPQDLPYRELDIVGDGRDHHCAGQAVLAELMGAFVDRRKEAGELDEAAAAALDGKARREEVRALGNLTSPAQDLGDVAVKVAYALRLGWHTLHDNGPTCDATLALLGSALADLVLLREAEAQRRYKLGEREYP